jgi:hypothetical protein
MKLYPYLASAALLVAALRAEPSARAEGISQQLAALQAQVASPQAAGAALQGQNATSQSQVGALQDSDADLQNQVNGPQAQSANARHALALDPYVNADPASENGVLTPNIVFSPEGLLDAAGEFACSQAASLTPLTGAG